MCLTTPSDYATTNTVKTASVQPKACHTGGNIVGGLATFTCHACTMYMYMYMHLAGDIFTGNHSTYEKQTTSA